MATKTKKKTTTRIVDQGRMYVKSTFNNTLVTFTDLNGQVIAWSSTGTAGFKGTRKSTPYAATTTIEDAVRKARERGLSSVEVFIKGGYAVATRSRPDPDRNIVNKHMLCAVPRALQKLCERGLNLF